MKFLFLDFETYYDQKDYTLRKMTPAEYILDPRFETICVNVIADDGPVQFVDGPAFKEWLLQFDPAQTTVITYNALFDMCILYWHYGFLPARMIDALGMARTLLGHKLHSLSLDKVSEYLKIGHKGTTILKVSGMRRADIMSRPTLWHEFKGYGADDARLLKGVFEALAPFYPRSEYRVMDLVLRCAVAPRFRVDMDLLTQHLADVRANKIKLLDDAAATRFPLDRASLMSADSFKAMLEDEGVEIEYKAGTNGMIPAFAKTDEFMANLLDSDNPRLQALAAARLGIKSTLEESRAERLLLIGGLNWERYLDGNVRFYSGGTMPIPLRLGGAHTLRLSGEWKINMQNMGRGSKLRDSLKAPPGCKVVVGDLGQIEARLTAWLCRCTVLMEAFTAGKDTYSMLATDIFGRPINRKLASDMIEGFIGKSGVLGLGFGAAAPKFYTMVIRTARAMGMDISALKKIWTMELANKSVTTFRRVNYQIPAMWQLLEQHLAGPWSGIGPSVKLGPVEIGRGYVQGPGGSRMQYELQPFVRGEDRLYSYAERNHKIYGAKFLENIIQFLARILLMHAALRLADRGLSFVLQAHDELAFIVPEADVENVKKIVHEELTRRPGWALDLPLTAEVGSGDSYGDAK